MKRREEIVRATKECKEDYVGLGRHLTTKDIADAFEEGAKWADKTMLDKVCDWLQCMAIDYIQGDITDIKLGSMFADPVRGCELYKNEGCSHVDGLLCDYPKCEMLKEYRKNGNTNKERLA